MTQHVRIATRRSPLALWQAEHVAARLQQAHSGVTVELVKIQTQGDKILDAPLAKIGGKGLFVKELEQGLLQGSADLAVHSMKDVPVLLPDGLEIAIIMDREDPRDAFVSNHHADLASLPQGAVVGTSSLRRQCQLLEVRPDLQIKFLRGNVNTRLAKLDAGEYDAIILATAGLVRLGFDQRIVKRMPVRESLPAVGQGAIGIECRSDDHQLKALLAALHDPETAYRVTAERAVNETLEGGCQAPIAAHARIKSNGLLRLHGLVAQPDGQCVLREEIEGPVEQAHQLGVTVGQRLLDRGGREILEQIYASH